MVDIRPIVNDDIHTGCKICKYCLIQTEEWLGKVPLQHNSLGLECLRQTCLEVRASHFLQQSQHTWMGRTCSKQNM